jgi:hypothetical protein
MVDPLTQAFKIDATMLASNSADTKFPLPLLLIVMISTNNSYKSMRMWWRRTTLGQTDTCKKTIYPALTISILLLSIFPMVANSFNFNEVAFGLEQQTQLQFAKSQQFD